MATYKDFMQRLFKNKAIADTPNTKTNNGYYNALVAASKPQTPTAGQTVKKAPQATNPYGAALLNYGKSATPAITQVSTGAAPKYQTPFQQLSPYAQAMKDAAANASAPSNDTSAPTDTGTSTTTPETETPAASSARNPNNDLVAAYAAALRAGGVNNSSSGYDRWLSDEGKAYKQQFEATMRQTELDYAKNQAAYGARGEALAQSGLTTSGYGDYTNQAAYAAMQGAKVDASGTFAFNSQQAYKQYLLDEESRNAALAAGQKAEADKAQATQLSANQRAAALAAEGYSDEESREMLGSIYGYDADVTDKAMAAGWSIGLKEYEKGKAAEAEATAAAETEAATIAQQQATEKQAKLNAAALELQGQGYTPNQISALLQSQGFTADEAKAAVESLQSNNAVGYSDTIAAATDPSQLPTKASLDTDVKLGKITEEQAAQFLADAQRKRAEMLKARFDMISDQELDAYFREADALYKSGDLSLADYTEIHKKGYATAIEQASVSDEPARYFAALVQGLDEEYKNGTMNKALYYNLRKYFSEQISISGLSGSKGNAVAGNLHYNATITVNGAKETVKLIPQAIDNSPAQQYPNASKGTIVMYGGKLYAYNGSAWLQMTIDQKSVGGKENAESLMDLIKLKAQVKAATNSHSAAEKPKVPTNPTIADMFRQYSK